VTTQRRTGGWLAEAFRSDRCTNIHIEEVFGGAAGLSRLRDEPFDAVLVSHQPGELDAFEVIEGYRASGAEEPIIALGAQSEQEMAALCFEAGADGYVCVNTTTTRHLIWILARAVQRYELYRENRRLALAENRRLQQEHDETDRLLHEQRCLIGDLQRLQHDEPLAENADRAEQASSGNQQKRSTRSSFSSPDQPPTPTLVRPDRGPVCENLPVELVAHYRELLRTYVIMGSGTLAEELQQLVRLLVRAGISARDTMQMHLAVLEDLVHGLGHRSTRHVMTRADLLILEIMMHLADQYRWRYHRRVHPPVQLLLPGFEDADLGLH
jgi:CheY-like chemotaxis protein